ncbi:hypothetical protein G9A89_000578 [Geosiphon pyriformis]|nr:hypothetical protein G9A89_000578 [Geosiphon pyriformis]
MAIKAKNSKKQQLALATALVILNSFVVPDEILGKIFTAVASALPDMDGNNSSTSPKIDQDQPLVVLPNIILFSRSLPIPVAKQSINLDDLKDWADQMEMELTVPFLVSGAVNGSAWENVSGHQKFSGWVASNLVPGAIFKIKMVLLSSLFQLLPGCIGLKSVSKDAIKLFCVEFASQESLNGATKVAINNEVFLTTFKIAWSFDVAFVSFPSLSIALHNVPLDISSDNIKSALDVFGVVTSVKLKPTGLWQYTVVYFKDTSSAAVVLIHWSVLVKKDSIRILFVTNQKEVIFLKDAFKAKLVNLSFGCIVFEISNLVSQVGGHICVVSLLPVVFFGSDVAVNTRLASLETQLSELSLLIKFIVEPMSFLVVLVTKLLFTPPVMAEAMKKSVIELKNQINAVYAVAFVLQKEVGVIKLKSGKVHFDIFNNKNIDDNNDDDNDVKDFSVYNNTFDVIIELWEVQSSNVKSDPNQTAKWISGLVKSNHELIYIMSKMYKLDMFNTLGSKGSANV